jgi:hypothetical protein
VSRGQRDGSPRTRQGVKKFKKTTISAILTKTKIKFAIFRLFNKYYFLIKSSRCVLSLLGSYCDMFGVFISVSAPFDKLKDILFYFYFHLVSVTIDGVSIGE